MRAVRTIGLDIAKSVFQVHGVDVDGQMVIRCKLKRRYAAVPRRYRCHTKPLGETLNSLTLCDTVL